MALPPSEKKQGLPYSLFHKMPRADYQNCRECGRHKSEAGELSHTRLCADCGKRIKLDVINQLHYHEGPWFNHWRVRIAASVGAVIPERLDTTPERR